METIQIEISIKTAFLKANKNKKEDLLLIEAVKSGDERAFNKIFNKYHDTMLFHLKTMTKSEEDAEELVLDAFIKMNSNLGKFDSELGAFSTWFFNLAKNIFIDNLRKKKLQEVSVSQLNYSSEEVLEDDTKKSDNLIFKSDSGTPESKLISKEQNNQMNEIIESLHNTLMVEVIKMRYYQNMSYDEISETLGLSLQNVKTIIHRTKELLKKKMKAKGIIYYPCKK